MTAAVQKLPWLIIFFLSCLIVPHIDSMLILGIMRRIRTETTRIESARALHAVPLLRLSIAGLLSFLFLATLSYADQTGVIVYVKAKGSKFIGSSVGGAKVTIRDTETGKILADGITTGPTGDTDLIMHTCRKEAEPIADESGAKFSAILDIDKPTHVEIKAYGPLAFPQAAGSASITQWLLPGKSIDQGDGVLIELSGLIVDIKEPVKEILIPDGKDSLQTSIPVQVTTL